MRKWIRRVGLYMLVMTLLLAVLAACTGAAQEEAAAPPAAGFAPQTEALAAAAEWLVGENQNADGGFGVNFETGEAASSAGATLDALLALGAAQAGGVDSEDAGAGAAAYLQDNAATLLDFAATGGGAGKTVLALLAAGADPADFAGQNWVENLTGQFGPSGAYNTADPFSQSLAILAVSAVGADVPAEATAWLRDLQAEDGSWDDGFGTLQNADATAMAIMALLAAGADATDADVVAARDFLASAQLPSGGWEYAPGFGENANSTALAIQALVALDEKVGDEGGAWAAEGTTPLAALLAWQGQSGAFQADFGEGRSDNFFATVQAMPALTGQPYPQVVIGE